MTPRELLDLKDERDKLQREADRAEGALQQIRERLQQEFEVSSLKEAERLLRKLEKEEQEAEREAEEKLTEYQEKWGSK